MTFGAARKHILKAINATTSILDEPRFAACVADPGQNIPFADLELDSLAAMEICMELEEKAGIEIDLGDLAVYPSVNELAEHVATVLAAK